MRVPSWISAPIQGQIKLTPRFDPALCNGCVKCVQVCAGKALATGKPPRLDKKLCIGCMCCAEVCPQGAIEPARSRLGQMIGL
jgi:MinD superfamily P-loop ATPase